MKADIQCLRAVAAGRARMRNLETRRACTLMR
jgi:hypothetical protein